MTLLGIAATLSLCVSAAHAGVEPVIEWSRVGARGAESIVFLPSGEMVRHARGQERRAQLAGVQLLQFRRWVVPAARDTIDWGDASVGRAVIAGTARGASPLAPIRKRAVREWLESLLTYTPDAPLEAVRHNAVAAWYRHSVPSNDTLIVSRSGAVMRASASTFGQASVGLPEAGGDEDGEEAHGASMLHARSMPRREQAAQPMSDADLRVLYWIHDTFATVTIPLLDVVHAKSRIEIRGAGERAPTPEERDRIWRWMRQLEGELR